MEKSIPKGTKCADCKKDIKIGDKNIGFWKEEGVYRCEACTDKKAGALVYSRVVGFLTPVKQWNVGKSAEWEDRKVFKI